MSVIIILQKEEKDAAALAVATVVDAATLYQQEASNKAKAHHRANTVVTPTEAKQVVDIDSATNPVLSKYRIANLNLW